MENKNESESTPSQPPPPRRKDYVPPEVRSLGRMSDRTLGVGGSRFDPGHHNNNKTGIG
jgi:hypothetical protein